MTEKEREILRVFEANKAKIPTSEKMIRRFPSGAVRSSSEGRPRPDWVSPYAIEEISKVLADNANDFGACNYMLGIPEDKCFESLSRHYLELQEELLLTKNPERIKIAARSLGFNVVALLHTIVLKEKGLYKEVYKTTELIPVSQAKSEASYIEK